MTDRSIQLVYNSDNSAQLSHGSISITGLRPSVKLLDGIRHESLVPRLLVKRTSRVRETSLGPCSEEEFLYQEGMCDVIWRIGKLKNHPAVVVGGVLHNSSDRAIRLKEFQLACGALVICAGDPKEWWLSTLQHSTRVGSLHDILPSENEQTIKIWEGFNMPIPNPLDTGEQATDGRWRKFEDFITLYSKGSATGLSIGPIGAPQADLNIACKVTDGCFELNLSSQMSDIIVGPGEYREAQEAVFYFGDYDESVRAILQALSTTHGSRISRRPPVGWCSWYDLGDRITQESIEATLSSLEEVYREIPLDVIQIDDGYQKQVGDWNCNEKFPDKMRNFVHRVKALGARPGIWVAPLAVHDSLGLLEEHPDWFQRTEDGNLAGEAGNWGAKSHWLDPSHPEAREFIRSAVRQKVDEGFTYFKIDFNSLQNNARFYDQRKTRLEVYRDLYRLYRETIGEESYLLACSNFTRGVFGHADAVRIGPDSVACWRAAHVCTLEECIRGVGTSALANGILFSNDPDVTYLRPRQELSEAEWQTWHGFVGLLGGLQFISEPMQEPRYKEALRNLEILRPPAPESGRVIGGGKEDYHPVFGIQPQRPFGNFSSILVWNPKDEESCASVNITEVIGCPGPCHVWSFWDRRYLGLATDVFTTGTLPPHGSALLRITPLVDRDAPLVIGSTLHITMGAAEVAEILRTAESLTVVVNKSGATNGEIFLHSSRELRLIDCVGCVASLEDLHNDIWKITLQERQLICSQRVRIKW